MQTDVKQSRSQRSIKYDLFLLAVLLIFINGVFLGSRPLAVPDEARYVEIPREMIVTGDFITPHLDLIKYFEKPPLFYWLQTLPMRYLGYSEWSLRLVTAFMGIMGCLLTFFASVQLFGRQIAWTAAIVLSSTLLYFAMSHLITIDMTLSTCLTGTLFSFLLATQTDQAAKRKYWMWASASCTALAVLSKGLVGILLPVGVVSLWLLCTRQWSLLRTLHLPSSTVLFLLLALPWHIIVQYRNPEFFDFYVITQQISRYFTLSAHRYQPVWFFLPVIFIGFFPWTGFILQAMIHATGNAFARIKTDKISAFLVLWVIIITVFFSLSHSKLIPYIIPIFPPLSILVAIYLTNQQQKRGISVGFAVSIVMSFLLAVALLTIPQFYPVPDSSAVIRGMSLVATIFVAGSSIAAWCYRQNSRRIAVITLACAGYCGAIAALPTVPAIDTHSIKNLAQTLHKQLLPDDRVVSYRHYYQDLPFYLQQRVIIVDWDNELSFGAAHQADATDWLLSRDQFLALWKSSQRVYMVARDKHIVDLRNEHPELTLNIIDHSFGNVLVSNREDTAS